MPHPRGNVKRVKIEDKYSCSKTFSIAKWPTPHQTSAPGTEHKLRTYAVTHHTQEKSRMSIFNHLSRRMSVML